MFVIAGALYGSKFAMSLLIRMVIVPPYCGVPSLSHQFPVAVVVVELCVSSGSSSSSGSSLVVVVVVLVVVVVDVGRRGRCC